MQIFLKLIYRLIEQTHRFMNGFYEGLLQINKEKAEKTREQ